MLLQIFLFLFGLLLVVWGADALVDGASSIARKFGISEFVIGLTIVGMGTSAPEMVVSFIGAIGGNADIAVGNVIGSNIFNTLLILGLTAMILPSCCLLTGQSFLNPRMLLFLASRVSIEGFEYAVFPQELTSAYLFSR